MNDDALAAVVAAARLIVARRAAGAPRDAGSRWALAARLRVNDAAGARRAAQAASRWTVAGRFHG